MSRVAKNPVKLPAGVEISIAGQQLSVKGAKGALELNVHPSVEVTQDSGELRFAARNGDVQNRAMAGTTRALVNNMVLGVSSQYFHDNEPGLYLLSFLKYQYGRLQLQKRETVPEVAILFYTYILNCCKIKNIS